MTDVQKREEIVRLMLTPQEKEALANAARDAGMPVAVWVRWVALKAAKAAREQN